MDLMDLPDVDAATANANTLFAWVAAQPESEASARAEALFELLLARASRSRASSTHACTKLVGVVQQCAERGTPAVRAWAFRPATAQQLLSFFLEWNERDQHRSMRLVLDLLALLVQKGAAVDAAAAATVRAHVLATLVAVIGHRSTRPLAKSAMASLQHLLAKGVFSLEEVAAAYQEEAAEEEGKNSTTTTTNTTAAWPLLVRDLFAWMALHYVCPSAGKLLVSVFVHVRRQAPDASTATATAALWLRWLRDGLAARPAIFEDVKLYLLIPLCKADREGALALLALVNQQQTEGTTTTAAAETDSLLQLAALEVGKKAGLVEESLPLDDAPSTDAAAAAGRRTIALDTAVLDEVLGRADTSVRSVALSLAVSSPSPTRPFAPAVLALLQRHLPGCHAEADARFRYELLAHERDMTTRLKGAMGALDKMAAPAADQLQTLRAQHEAFFTWYLGFLCTELAPTASYQRHFTALRATAALLRVRRDVSGGHGDAVDAAVAARLRHDGAWVRGLLDLLVDPFEDVREAAMGVLGAVAAGETEEEAHSSNDKDSSLTVQLVALAARADALALRTARADHADGAARCHGLLAAWAADETARIAVLDRLLDRLEAKLAAAEADLPAAAAACPLHGDFAALRYVWDVLARRRSSDASPVPAALRGPAQERVVRCAERAWAVVRGVLCDDSPEGLLPDDMEDLLDTKDLLSYSFRAVNESSNTLRAIIGQLRFGRARGALLPSPAVFAAVGHLSFAQLAALRHRGALAAVGQTFVLCCQLAPDPLITSADTPAEDTLLLRWYRATLACIDAQVSTTRRSAGLPALFAAVLAPAAARPSLDEAVATAAAIARRPAHQADADGVRLPQVHALNCLRDVFRSSLLSKRAERLLPDCLQLAASMLQSDVWAIRNCGLLLLRSLIDCLFGTGESKASLASGWDGRTIRVSYNKYPTLPAVLLALLTPATAPAAAAAVDAPAPRLHADQLAAESVFPALDILRRAGPPETLRDDLYAAVLLHLASPLWHVREMAARTVCSFLVAHDWPAALADLLAVAASCREANRLHGILLAVRFLLLRVANLHEAVLAAALPSLLAQLRRLETANPLLAACPPIEATYLATLNTMAGQSLALSLCLPVADWPATADDTSSALLRIQRALHANYAARQRNDRAAVRRRLLHAASVDPDTAAPLLDAVVAAWWSPSDRSRTQEAAWLAALCADVCLEGPAALRAAALVHLADLLDWAAALTSSVDDAPLLLLPAAALARVWSALRALPALAPNLVCAVLRVSGPFAAAAPSLVATASWAAMIARAAEADHTWDSRMAAVTALRSFAASAPTVPLPLLWCLYDALNDDDDDIRAVAATAAGAPAVLAAPLVSAEAARQLPLWMASRFGRDAAFRTQAAWRAVGSFAGAGAGAGAPVAASARLRAALRSDDALFSIEEQNLYVDEVREAARWGDVVRQIAVDDAAKAVEAADDACFAALRPWIADGLQALVQHARATPDGPLGWSAAPAVFAVSAHLLIGARALSVGPHSADLAQLLDAFRAAGTAARVHPLLLALV